MSAGNKPSKWELRRRDFLRGLGAGAALLPLLGETQARAQAKTGAGRLIVMVKGNGVRAETFWPTFPGGRPGDGSLSGATLPHAIAPLAQWKDRLTFLDGLTLRNWLRSEGNSTGDNGDAHHNWGSLLTGELPSNVHLTDGGCRANGGGCRMQAGSVSLDCYVGQELRKKEPSIAFDSIHVSLNVDDLAFARRASGFNCPSWFKRDQPNPPEPDAAAVFARLFGGKRMAGASMADTGRLADRVRLLDFVGKDLERFVRRLGTEDRQKAESHLDAVRRRQDELARVVADPGAGLACVRVAEPTAAYVTKKEAHVPALAKLMADMLVDAFKCGLARTACYSLFDSNTYHTYFTWMKNVNANFGSASVSEFKSSHFHALAHGNGSEPGTSMYRDANRWFVEQYAYMIDRLAKEPEGTGSMLDSTLVLWADSLSNGGGHQVTRLPWILAGNVNKRFRTGRHLQLPGGAAPNGVFLAIAEALGVPPASGVFGNAKFGKDAYAPLLA